MARSSKHDKPRLACEISPDRVIAARAGDGGTLGAFSSRTLPAGSLLPSLTGGNIAGRDALRQAISDTVSAVGGRSRDVIAVLPDAAVRIALLDFDTLPDKRQEADGVVRFRLKKSLPFDVEQASLSYTVERSNGQVRAVAAVAQTSVLQEYESAFREAGLQPGVVLPSMLAALGSVDASQPTLVVKADAATTSLAIVQDDRLLLFRTLENSSAEVLDVNRLAEDIYPSLVFFQDNYGVSVERVLVGGVVAAEKLGPALQAQTGASIEDLVVHSQLGSASLGNLPASLLAGVLGALS